MRVFHDYRGAAIRLTDERMAHILRHPEMTGLEAAIDRALTHPETVVESLSDPLVRLYYRPFLGPPRGARFLCVVVRDSDHDAFVLTAYLTDRVKRGVPLWPRNT